MTGETQPPALPDIEKLINSAVAEAVKPLAAEIALLKEGQKKTNEAFQAVRLASEKVTFSKLLNAANVKEADQLFEAYKADPTTWLLENKDKLMNAAPGANLVGKASNSAAVSDIDAARGKVLETLNRRR